MRNIGIVAQLHLGIAAMSAQCNTKLTKFSLKCHPIHPGLHKLYRCSDLRYSNGCHSSSWNSKLAILECACNYLGMESQISR